MKPRAPAPIVLALIIVIAVSAAWALVAPPFLHSLEAAVGSKIESVASSALDGLGLSVSYRAASPRLFGSVALSGVELRDGGRLVASVGTAELSYDAKALLRGSFVPGKLTLDDVSIDSDYLTVSSIVKRLADRFSGGGSGAKLPAGMALELRRAKVRLSGADGAWAEASIRAADIVTRDDGSIGASVAGTLRAVDPSRRMMAGRAEAPFSASASIRLDPLEADIEAELSADTDVGSLSRITVSAGVDSEGAAISLARIGGLTRLEASWNALSERTTIDAVFSGWRPDSLLKPRGSLAFLAPWLGSVLSGSAHASTDFSAAGTVADIEVSGTVPVGMPGGNPRVILDVDGTWSSLFVHKASLTNDAIAVSYSGELNPASLGARGTLDASYALAPGISAEATFELFGSAGSWFAYASSIRAADTALTDSTLSMEIAGTSISFYFDAASPIYQSISEQALAQPAAAQALADDGPAGRAQNGQPGGALEPASEAASTRLIVEGSATFEGEPYIEAVVRLGSVRLGAFKGIVEAMLGRAAAIALEPLSIGGDISMYSDFKALSFSSSGFLLVYDGAVSGFGAISFAGGLGRLDLRSIDATIAGYAISGSASLDYGNPAGSGFDADIQVQGIPYKLSGAVMDGSLSISGDYGLRALARYDPDSASGSLSVVDMPIPVLGTVSFLSAAATARYASAGDWGIVIERLSLSQPPGAPKSLPTIEASGSFDEGGGRFGRLAYADATSAVEGVMDVTWAMANGYRVSGNGNLRGADGEYYSLEAEYRSDGGLDAVLSAKKSPLARLNMPVLKGVADIDATISGSAGNPAAAFNFTVNGGQRSEELPFAAGSGSYRGGTVTLEDTRIRLGKQKVAGLRLSYGLADAAAELSADVELVLGKNVFTGALRASGASSRAAGAAGSPLDDYDIAGLVKGAALTGSSLGDIPLAITRHGGATDALLGSKGEVKASIGPGGELRAAMADSLPISLSAEGRYRDGSLSLDVSDARADVPFLFKMIGLPIVRFDSGVASGSLKIRGRLTDPTVEGVVHMDNVYISVPDFVPIPIGPLTEPIYFTGRTMETLQPSVACGDAKVMARLDATLHGGIPDDVFLTVQTNDGGLVPVSTKLLGLDIKGMARPDLVIEANVDRSRIRGSIAMASGDIELTLGVVKRKSAAPSASNMSGSLDLSFGKGVRVYFPGKNLPVIYGQTDPSSRLTVAFDTASGDYSLKGATVLRGGSIWYIQRNFYLKTATIEFDEDADQFDPSINAEAETRSTTSSGPVVISLRAVNSRLSHLSFVLDSVPSMSEAELQHLLGQNFIGASSSGSVDIVKWGFENSDLIPALNVASILERNVQSLLGLDLFVVRTLAFQRLLYDVSGLSVASTATSLADYLDDTAVVAGKYIGDKLFFQLMLTLVADPLASSTALSLDSDISLEWKAPHFTLNWSVQPKNLDSLFIEDQSFSFLWRIPLK